MIPPDYQAVAVRLARLGRNDAYSLVEAAIARGMPALELLCIHLDATLARYRALPACTSTAALPALSASNGPNRASAPKVPPKAATPAQAATMPARATTEPMPAQASPEPACPERAEPAKHGADDAAARAQLRAAMQAQAPAPEPNSPSNEPNSPSNEPNSPSNESAPVLQLPVVANGGELFIDAVGALVSLGYGKSEARRMAKIAIEYGAASVEDVIKACTRKAK